MNGEQSSPDPPVPVLQGSKLQLPPSCDPPSLSNPPEPSVWVVSKRKTSVQHNGLMRFRYLVPPATSAAPSSKPLYPTTISSPQLANPMKILYLQSFLQALLSAYLSNLSSPNSLKTPSPYSATSASAKPWMPPSNAPSPTLGG